MSTITLSVSSPISVQNTNGRLATNENSSFYFCVYCKSNETLYRYLAVTLNRDQIWDISKSTREWRSTLNRQRYGQKHPVISSRIRWLNIMLKNAFQYKLSILARSCCLLMRALYKKISKVFANCMSQVGYFYCIFIFSENWVMLKEFCICREWKYAISRSNKEERKLS